MMFERCDKMDKGNGVCSEDFNHKDTNIISELSDDSDIEILTPNEVEESTSICENNLLDTQEIDQKCYSESLETNDDPSTDVEIINLSSDDEETNISEDHTLESQNITIDYISEDSESSYEQMEIEIETDNEKINIKQNNHSNLDELLLGSDEECVMFDFSNYSADDVLRAVESNKLSIDESETQNVNSIHESETQNVNSIDESETQNVNSIDESETQNVNSIDESETQNLNSIDESETQNVNVEITTNFLESNIEIEESKISTIDTKTDSDIDVENISTKSEPDVLEISSDNNIQSICHTNENTDCKINNEVISETRLILKCRKCDTPGSMDIAKLRNVIKRKCRNCSMNMSFQCKTCTCLFHSLISFYNHLKNYHMRNSKKILQSIDNLSMKYPTKGIRNRQTVQNDEKKVRKVKRVNTVKKGKKRQKVQRVQKVQKVQRVQKVQKVEEKKTIYQCVNCSQTFQSAQFLRIHRANCIDIPYLYCRFCPLNVQSIKELREHMTRVHYSKINLSDLNQILQGIEQEGYKIIDMKSILLITCVGCNFVQLLNHHERQCYRCRSSLMYKCGERTCGLLFPTPGELISHVRQQHLHSWHRCNVCGDATSECADATRHRLLRHPESHVTYRHCQDCHYEASSPGDMSSHVHSAHGAAQRPAPVPYRGPFVCKACGKVFKLEHRLRKHQRSFCRKICRTYDCAHCRYTSLDKEKLLQHLRCSHVYVFTGRKLKCHRCRVEVASIYKLNSHMGKCKVQVSHCKRWIGSEGF